MKLSGYFSGEKAIAFWTNVYMTVTGSLVSLPPEMPRPSGDPSREALEQAADIRAEVETAA